MEQSPMSKPATVEPPANSKSPSKRPATYGATTRPQGGFELFSWYFFRITGVIMVFMVILHLVIMHLTNDVSQTVYDFVAARYANPFWRGLYPLLLTFSLLPCPNWPRVRRGC